MGSVHYKAEVIPHYRGPNAVPIMHIRCSARTKFRFSFVPRTAKAWRMWVSSSRHYQTTNGDPPDSLRQIAQEAPSRVCGNPLHLSANTLLIGVSLPIRLRTTSGGLGPPSCQA